MTAHYSLKHVLQKVPSLLVEIYNLVKKKCPVLFKQGREWHALLGGEEGKRAGEGAPESQRRMWVGGTWWGARGNCQKAIFRKRKQSDPNLQGDNGRS